MKKKFTNKNKLMFLFIGVAVLLAIVAAVVFFATRVTNDSYANCAVGDVDGNGYINSSDAVLVERYLKGEEDLFDTQIKNGDVNLDGNLDKLDVEIIQKYATGQVKKLPVTDESTPTQIHNDSVVYGESEKAKSSVQVENSWSNGDGTYSYQLKVNVENINDSRLRNWETRISLSEDIRILKSWDCECESDGETVIITGETISAGEKMNCGVIVKASKEMKIESITTEN